MRQTSTLRKVGLLVLVAAVVLGGLLWHDPSEVRASAVHVLDVAALAVQKVSSYERERAYSGLVETRRSGPLGFESAGRVLEIPVAPGTRVEAGAPLAVLDSAEVVAARQSLAARRDRAQAELEEMLAGHRPETIAAAQAGLRQRAAHLQIARMRVARQELLLAENRLGQQAIDEVRGEVTALEAQVEEAEQQLAELIAGVRLERINAQQATLRHLEAELTALDLRLQRCVVRAPWPGRVAELCVTEGAVLAPGQPVLCLVGDRDLRARIGVPPEVAAALEDGRLYRLEIGGRRVDGRLTARLPELDASTRLQALLFALDGQPGAVIGQSCRLLLSVRTDQPGIWLPVSALHRGERGLWSCLALVPLARVAQAAISAERSNPLYRLETRMLEVVALGEGEVFVQGQLVAGELVVASAPDRLAPGQVVRTQAALP